MSPSLLLVSIITYWLKWNNFPFLEHSVHSILHNNTKTLPHANETRVIDFQREQHLHQRWIASILCFAIYPSMESNTERAPFSCNAHATPLRLWQPQILMGIYFVIILIAFILELLFRYCFMEVRLMMTHRKLC